MCASPEYRRALALALLAALALQGCARLPYAQRPLDLEASAATYEARRADDPELRGYLAAHGHSDWPVREWGLAELTLLAFFFRPEFERARASARVARLEVDAASQRPPLGIAPRVEHHSEEGADDTPWSLGFEVEIPLATQGRRAALVERAEVLAQAAELDAGAQAWRVRREVRSALLELYAAREQVRLLELELEHQRSAQSLLERRLAAGYASLGDVDALRLRVAQTQADLASARTRAQAGLGALSAALALPLARTRELSLSFAAFDTLPEAPDDASARRDALINRVDLRTGLLEFAAADAEVKLEVARQYPTLALRPGYLWDQGDNVWSLALDLALPASLTHGPAIRVAEARRDAAAQQVLSQQEAVIAQTAARLATYRQAVDGARATQAASTTQLARSAQLQRQFDVGQADRLELTLARAEALLVERRRLEALVDAQRHLGALEDAMQRPLAGGPLPAAPVRGVEGAAR
jgi:outer membrane protein TolC